MRYWLIAALTLFLTLPLRAQSRGTEFLRRMDANGNGRLEPDEISDRARPYLERFAREAGIRLSGSVSVSQLEAAARRYYERSSRDNSSRSGSTSSSSSSSSIPESVTGVRGFGPDEDTPLVPGFGPDAAIRYPFTGADEAQADERIRQYDGNADGNIDRAEAARGRWSDNPFVYDFNDDGMLSRIELAQRYARRRTAESNGVRSASTSSRGDDRSRDERPTSDDRRSREYGNRGGDTRGSGDPRRSGGPDRRTYELAYSVVSRLDRNRNGMLDRPEWTSAGENISEADADRNGEITRGELAEWMAHDIRKRYKDFSDELPGWFFDLDANQDHQISMSEFAQEWSEEKLEEFAGLDRNGDGLLTEKELLRSRAVVGGTYTNEKAVVIMPAGVLVTKIFVDDDFLIGDVDVQLSITHTNVEQLNAYLIGPDGQRIELFSGVGRSDDHFDGTILDDEAEQRITRARPPFQGRFLPEAAEKDGPSLSHFYGKSVHGDWQLEIRTSRGDRPGMLHGWSLIVGRPDKLDSDTRDDEFLRSSDQQRESAGDGRPLDGEYRPPDGEGRPSFRGRYRSGDQRPSLRDSPPNPRRPPWDR